MRALGSKSLEPEMINLDDYEILVPEELVNLVPGFVSRREEDVRVLESLIKEKKFAEIAQLAHKLKGHGTSYGFDAVSELGKKIEFASKRKDFFETDQFIRNLHIVVKDLSKRFN